MKRRTFLGTLAATAALPLLPEVLGGEPQSTNAIVASHEFDNKSWSPVTTLDVFNTDLNDPNAWDTRVFNGELIFGGASLEFNPYHSSYVLKSALTDAELIHKTTPRPSAMLFRVYLKPEYLKMEELNIRITCDDRFFGIKLHLKGEGENRHFVIGDYFQANGAEYLSFNMTQCANGWWSLILEGDPIQPMKRKQSQYIATM